MFAATRKVQAPTMRHIKIYNNFFGYQSGDYRPCEICGAPGTDIHHMDSRGMGGDPKGTKDTIENLMALCRKCHEEYGDKEQYDGMLYKIHMRHVHLKNVADDLYKHLMSL